MTDATNLPEGVLRSTFLPLEIRGGTKMFLSYENGKYVVHTRFETFKRSSCLQKAGDYYDDVLSGKVTPK